MVCLELLRDNRRWEAHLVRRPVQQAAGMQHCDTRCGGQPATCPALQAASPGRISQAGHGADEVDAATVQAVVRIQALARGNRARHLLLKVALLAA